MRENLLEMNDLGLAETPVLLGGAALTRNYVEVDLREVYEGRLFYGKDAFEGLHTMDTLMTAKKTGTIDPDLGRAPGGRKLPPRKSQQDGRSRSTCRRAPTSPTTSPIFTPPFLGARVAKGISLDEIAGFINETALFRNQWQFRPEGGESDDEFKARIRPTLRAELDGAKSEGWLVPAVAWGYFPVNAAGDDLVVWTDDDRTHRAAAGSTSRASRRRRSSASPTSSAASTPATPTTPAFHVVTVGSRGDGAASASCSRRTSTRTTCCATASRWR